MTAYINKLKDVNSNQQLPVTHERAVRDDNGTTAETKFQNLEGAMDKAYVANSDNGMGRITLHKNMVSEVNTLTQSMMQATNTIYVIRYDFTLGEDITVPANCVLEFDGGSISGEHTITGQNTGIEASDYDEIFNGITLLGTWDNNEMFASWFGYNAGDGKDCHNLVANFIPDVILRFSIGVYKFSETIIKKSGIRIQGESKGFVYGTYFLPYSNNQRFVIKIGGNTNFSDDEYISGVELSGITFSNTDKLISGVDNNYGMLCIEKLYKGYIDVQFSFCYYRCLWMRESFEITFGDLIIRDCKGLDIDDAYIYLAPVVKQNSNLTNIIIRSLNIEGVSSQVMRCVNGCSFTNSAIGNVIIENHYDGNIGNNEADSVMATYKRNYLFDLSGAQNITIGAINTNSSFASYQTIGNDKYMDGLVIVDSNLSKNITISSINVDNGYMFFGSKYEALPSSVMRNSLSIITIMSLKYRDPYTAANSVNPNSIIYEETFNTGVIRNGLIKYVFNNNLLRRHNTILNIDEKVSNERIFKLFSQSSNRRFFEHLKESDITSFFSYQSDNYSEGEFTLISENAITVPFKVKTNAFKIKRYIQNQSGLAYSTVAGVYKNGELIEGILGVSKVYPRQGVIEEEEFHINSQDYDYILLFASLQTYYIALEPISYDCGATANRPTDAVDGFQFFDTTLNKPIWWNGTAWVDATGATV